MIFEKRMIEMIFEIGIPNVSEALITNQISFFVAGIPVPKARGRVTMFHGRPMVYTPKQTAMWEQRVKWLSMEHRPGKLPGGPIVLFLHFVMQRPKSLNKKFIHHIKKPDLDNLAKSILDAMQGSYFRNDSQVIHLSITKAYGAPQGVHVKFYELSPESHDITI